MDQHAALDRLRTRLERIARRRPGVPPPQVLVDAPGLAFEFGAPSRPFHAASVGKVMTATLIARLVEQGELAFDSPIGSLLPAGEVAGLPAAVGVDVATDVTVAHLLTHTSGLPDYFEPPRGSDSACSVGTVVGDRDRRWTPGDLLDEARRLPAVGRPGERFAYSDTAFVLLGRIAEEVGAESLEVLLEKHIYEPSGMAHSSTPYSTARAPEDLLDVDVEPFWIGAHELSRAPCVSIDWAGGGIVAPAGDLVSFQRALHGGALVSPATLERMVRPLHRRRRGIHYGTGTVTVRFGEFLPPFLRGLPEPVGGLGHFATHMFYYPRQDAHVVLNFHGYRWMRQSFEIHSRIARLLEHSRRSPSGSRGTRSNRA